MLLFTPHWESFSSFPVLEEEQQMRRVFPKSLLTTTGVGRCILQFRWYLYLLDSNTFPTRVKKQRWAYSINWENRQQWKEIFHIFIQSKTKWLWRNSAMSIYYIVYIMLYYFDRSGGTELCSTASVSSGMYLPGHGCTLQQQTPIVTAKRDPKERHWIVSITSKVMWRKNVGFCYRILLLWILTDWMSCQCCQ